jgi:DNA-binding NtrC family response regulator
MSPGTGPFSVLIVDDESSLLFPMSIELESLGTRVLTAQSGNAAIQVLSAEPVHLIISDIRMPDGDGFELLRWVKTHRPEIPVALMTGFTDVTGKGTLPAGAERFFWKPFDPEELTGWVSERQRQVLSSR